MAAKSSSSRALVQIKASDLARTKAKPSDQNLTAMVKKFMEKRSGLKSKAVNWTSGGQHTLEYHARHDHHRSVRDHTPHHKRGSIPV
ncbi:hypothetical protein SDJN03_15889, partial [Cucurbita argyrosperma subsp. sororia]